MSGGAGDDSIDSGYLGARSVDGGAGNDRILASAIGNGGFEYSGGTGDDRISAQNTGTISMFGDEGNDTLNFFNGDGTVSGGDGNDLIISNNNDIEMTGGSGTDAFALKLGSDTDVITDFTPSADTLFVTYNDSYQTAPLASDLSFRQLPEGEANAPAVEVVLDLGDGEEEVMAILLGDYDLADLNTNDVTIVQRAMLEDAFNSTVTSGATAGDDTLTGTGANDIINALAGDDLVEGRDGSDTIHGQEGADTILGGAGDDFISTGDDTIVYDNTVPGPIDRGPEDEAFGGIGDDTIEAGERDAELFGEDGNDVLLGGSAGVQILDGGAGDDTLIAGDADRVVQTPLGGVIENSALIGGDGDDVILLGDEYTATGGEGADTFIATDGASFYPQILDFTREDDVLVIDYPEGTTAPEYEDLRYQTVPRFFRTTFLGAHLNVGVENDDGDIEWLARIDNLGGSSPAGMNPFTYPAGTQLLLPENVVFATPSEIEAMLGQGPANAT